jgi:hypothetical protein
VATLRADRHLLLSFGTAHAAVDGEIESLFFGAFWAPRGQTFEFLRAVSHPNWRRRWGLPILRALTSWFAGTI